MRFFLSSRFIAIADNNAELRAFANNTSRTSFVSKFIHRVFTCFLCDIFFPSQLPTRFAQCGCDACPVPEVNSKGHCALPCVCIARRLSPSISGVHNASFIVYHYGLLARIEIAISERYAMNKILIKTPCIKLKLGRAIHNTIHVFRALKLEERNYISEAFLRNASLQVHLGRQLFSLLSLRVKRTLRNMVL